MKVIVNIKKTFVLLFLYIDSILSETHIIISGNYLQRTIKSLTCPPCKSGLRLTFSLNPDR